MDGSTSPRPGPRTLWRFWPYALLLVVGAFVLLPRLGDYGFWDPWEPKYAETARELSMTEGAVKVAVHRMRTRFREVFREEVAHTLADPAEVDDEIAALMQAL